MPQRLSADRTAKLLLWNQKEKARLRADPRREASLLDAETVFKLALGRQVEFSDPALQRVSATTLRDAAVAHVRQFHFRADATLYEVLGVSPDATEQEIREAFRFLMQLIHPDRQGDRREWPDAFAARANHAYAILRNVDARARFDREEAQRAAQSRAAQRAAAVAAAPPAPHWRKPGRVTRGPPPRAVLPEWLTAGVGGFARAHPAVVAFGMLIGIALLVIGSAAWEPGAGRLAREAREPLPNTLPAPRETTAAAVAAAPEPASNVLLIAAAPPPAPALARAQVQAPEAGAGARPVAGPGEGAGTTGGAGRSAPATDLRTVRRDEPPPTVAPTPAPIAPTPAPVAATPARVAPTPAPVASTPERVAPPMNAVPPLPALAVAAPTVADAPPVRAVAVPDAPAVRAVASPPVRVMAAPPPTLSAAAALAPKADEIEAQFVAFVDAYNRGRLDAMAALFDDDAQTNQRQGRAAIRRDYDELFRRSDWRRMNVARMSWKLSGDVAQVTAEGAVRIAWRDGREAEERLALDMDLARRDGRVVIIRLAQRVGAP